MKAHSLEGVAHPKKAWFYNTAAIMHCSDFSGPDCRLPPAREGIFSSVAGVRIVTSLLGIIGSFSIIALALLKKRVFNPEVHPIFALSLADCVLAVLWISGSSLWLSPPDYDRRWCYAVAVLTIMLECITINLILVYAIFAFISTSKTDLNSLLTHTNKGISRRFIFQVYCIAVFVPVILVLAVFMSIIETKDILNSINNCTCWHENYPVLASASLDMCIPTVVNIVPFAPHVQNGNSSALYDFKNRQHYLTYGLGGLTIVNYVVVFIGLVVLYFKILRRIKKIRMEHDDQLFGRGNVHYGTAESSRIVLGQARARKRVVIFLTLFLLTGLSNILITVCAIALFAERPSNKESYHPSHTIDRFQIFTSFLLIQAVAIGLQGFVNAIAYGWTRDDFVQIITVPLTEEQPEQSPTDISDKEKERNEQLEVSDLNSSYSNDLIETVYPESAESDVD